MFIRSAIFRPSHATRSSLLLARSIGRHMLQAWPTEDQPGSAEEEGCPGWPAHYFAGDFVSSSSLHASCLSGLQALQRRDSSSLTQSSPNV